MSTARLTKNQAIEAFGGASNLAKALQLTRQAIFYWPDELDLERHDRVVGAAHRLNIELPEQLNSTNNSGAEAS